MPRVMQRSQLSKSSQWSQVWVSPGSAQLLFISADSRLPSAVISGSLPFGGSTISEVCRWTGSRVGDARLQRAAEVAFGDRRRMARPPRPAAAASRSWYSSSVRNALLGSHGGGRRATRAAAAAQRSSGTLPTNEMGHIP